MSPYRTLVCFDLFHTLVRPLASSGASYEDVLVRLGVPREVIYPFVRAELMTCNASIEDLVERLFCHVERPIEQYREAFLEAVAAWRDDNRCEWIDGALSVLRSLQAEPDLALCLVSNATRPGWEAVNGQLLVRSQFHALQLSWEQGISKPNTECWTRPVARLGISHLPNVRCWMVGDNQVDDLNPPSLMGWNTALAARDGSNLTTILERILASHRD